MTSLSRRLERLEAGCRQSDEIAADRCRNIHRAAYKHLPLDQLKCLLAAITSYQQGRGLTSEEAAAAEAFNSAVAVECQKAGFKSLAEFKRYCRHAKE